MARSKDTYYNNTSLAVQRVNVPDKIKCTRCHKIKNQHAFSTNQQNELKAKILDDPRFNATLSEWVSCLQCTPSSQRFEFKCYDCDVVKGRKQFYKTQLRNPDRALCIPCSKRRRDTEPGGASDDDDNSSNSSGSRDSDDSCYGGGGGASDDEGASTMAGTMSGLSLHGTDTGTSSFQTSVTGGVKLAGATTGIASYTSAASRVASSSGVGAGGGGAAITGSSTAGGSVTPAQSGEQWPAHWGKGAASVVGSEARSYSTGAIGSSRRAAPFVGSAQTSGKGKFAKVRAGKQTARQAVTIDNGDEITTADSSGDDSD
ncbi:hypothetical protein B0A55_00358 [Friedmanniomyces simplex]|uniref:Stc1 domain-containing protein n=1 Tax=Friedmanniomyces simplex TaxID=329884 RepID=A0A4U0Y5D1_9PEZI|nr:hypothetical protein B0A55_00358 [Friedmanniomyces simplex]